MGIGLWERDGGPGYTGSNPFFPSLAPGPMVLDLAELQIRVALGQVDPDPLNCRPQRTRHRLPRLISSHPVLSSSSWVSQLEEKPGLGYMKIRK